MNYQCYEDIKTQAAAWKAALSAVDARSSDFEMLFAEPPSELLFTACGSPYYIGLSNIILWREYAGLHATAMPSSEIMIFPEATLPRVGNPIMIAASRSGETTETVEAVKAFAAKFPGRMILVSCQQESSLQRLADLEILIPDGYDDVVPQTRSFGSMYLAVQYLAALVSGYDELAGWLRRLPGLLETLIDRWESTIRLVAESEWNSAVFLGGGSLYGMANEGALKLTEMALDFAASYHTLEVRHGPRSTIDERTLVVGLGTNKGAPQEQQVMEEQTVQTSQVLALVPGGPPSLESVQKISLEQKIPDHALGMLYMPILQLLAYHRSIHKGLNPDQSRNLTNYVELPDES